MTTLPLAVVPWRKVARAAAAAALVALGAGALIVAIAAIVSRPWIATNLSLLAVIGWVVWLTFERATSATRHDKTDAQIVALWRAIPAKATEPPPRPVDLPTDPGFERPRPAPGPITQPSELEAVVAVTADDWLQKWDQDLAELRAKWDAEDAA